MSAAASSNDNFSFAIYGVADGEYDVSAAQFLPSRDELRSPPRRVTVRGADVTGVTLTLAAQPSIEGRLAFESDPKAGCGKRRETVAQETIVFGRQYEPEKKTDAVTRPAPLADPSALASNFVALGVGDEKGSFALRNLRPGSYRIDPHAPAGGWYLRSIAIGSALTAATRNASLAMARDGVTVKASERISGLTVTFTEGAASLRGRVSVAEGQRFRSGVRVYLVPVEKESAADVLRFFETRAESDSTFAVGNIAPGKYWMVAQPYESRDGTAVKPIRQDSDLRVLILREAEKLKRELVLKPCERVIDYDLSYQP